ncbi:uncharacterized protein LOC117325034 [Pecten maximus]|uniref:uncharacterized protein LOC117325034 n=1 Tax=Pecten maximus TaxID=6579 RepID=UPI0014587ECF|nr:uncharacterized protein LOC117325034 [Pecten maximus]XP_033736829.1 uncharacterized protein LOC117325034 [Pecten maximus]
MNYAAAAASRGSGSKVKDVTSTGATGLYPRLPNTENDFPALPTRSNGPTKSTPVPTERPANYVLSSSSLTSDSECQREVPQAKQRGHIGEGRDHNEHDKNTVQNSTTDGTQQGSADFKDMSKMLLQSTVSEESKNNLPINPDSHDGIQPQEVSKRSDFDSGPSQHHSSHDIEQQNFLQQQDTNVMSSSSGHMARSSPQDKNLFLDNDNNEQPNSLGKSRSKVDWNGRNQTQTEDDPKRDHKQGKVNTQSNSGNRLQGSTDDARLKNARDQGFKDQEMSKQNSFQQSQNKQKGNKTNEHGREHAGYSYQPVTESGARPKVGHHQGKHNRRYQQPDSAGQVESVEEAFKIDPVLQERYKDDKKSMFEFFWQSDSVYSQWHIKEFDVESTTYICAEQFMMHRKATLFEDYRTARKIMETRSPRKQKQLGRQVKNFDEALWQANCEAIVEEGSTAKFDQNSGLLNIICASNPRILVEASPVDRIWGIGLSSSDPEAWNRATWRGENRLGKILTKVRNKLMLKRELMTKEEHDRQLKELER